MARARIKKAAEETPSIDEQIAAFAPPKPIPKGMRLLQLKITDFMRVFAVDISPNGEQINLFGANDQGKSTILTAIWTALGGGDVEPDKPVREGAKEAQIELTLGEINLPEAIVRYRRTADQIGAEGEKIPGKRYLELTKPDGSKFPQAQTTLDTLIGKSMFDPLAFMRLKPDQQAATLARIAGIDIKAHTMFRKGLYDQRTEANRRAKEAKENADAAQRALTDAYQRAGLQGPPKAAIDVAEVMQELKDVQSHNEAIDEQVRDVKRHTEIVTAQQNKVTIQKNTIERIKLELSEAEDELKDENNELEQITAKHNAMRLKVGKLVGKSTVEIENRINNADVHNSAFRAVEAVVEAKKKMIATKDGADAADAKIESCDEDFEKKLAASPLPVKGLTFTAESVLYNGIPLDQEAKSKQLRISAEISAAENHKCRIMTIQDCSLLDENGRKILQEVGERMNVQLMMEFVGGKDGKGGYLIEDGRVTS